MAHPLSAHQEHLVLSFDALGWASALLLISVLMLAVTSQPARSRTRMGAFALLASVSLSIASCTASNLLTLSIAWAGCELMLVFIRFSRVLEEGVPQARRGVRTGMASVTALLLATLLIISEHDTTSLMLLGQARVPFLLVLLAALLRIAPYPLPAALNRRWQVHIISLVTGGCLLFRLTPILPTHVPSMDWPISIAGGAYLVTALLTALPPDWSRALPYALATSVAAAILGPSLDASAGGALAALALAHTVICIGILRIDMEIRTNKPLGKRSRLPLAITMASLAGWPLTLGFMIDWALVVLCLQAELPWLALLIGVAVTLLSVPVWRRLLRIGREIVQESAVQRSTHVAFACALPLAIFILLAGIVVAVAPMLLRSVPLPGFADLGRALLWGRTRWASLVCLATLPLTIGYVAHRARSRAEGTSARAVDFIGGSLDLEWLYVGLITMIERAEALAVRALVSIEESLFLVWTLLWGLIIVLFLVGQ